MNTKQWKTFIATLPAAAAQLAAVAALAGVLAGCGSQEFQVARSVASQKAPGSLTVQPKVDILLAEDDTGSMNEVYSQISTRMPAMLANLEAKGWNYHFATTPLTTKSQISQVIASKFDSNWSSLGGWLAPYPGATAAKLTDLTTWLSQGNIAPSYFSTPDEYTGWVYQANISNSRGGQEPGLATIADALTNRLTPGNFLRPDALLVVLVVGNGNDTSGITYCTRQDGATVPCEQTSGYSYCSTNNFATSYLCYYNMPQTLNSSMTGTNGYEAFFKNFKSSPSLLKFYAAVAANQTASNCLGAPAYAGSRYMDIATKTGGASIDICSQYVSGAIDLVESNLQDTQLNLRTHYLLLASEPDQVSIQVTKYPGGDTTQAVTIPNDATNGWTYAGNQTNVYQIDGYVNPDGSVSTLQMNLISGYMIELHGTAELIGADTSDVSFTPAGAKNSS